MKNRLSRNHWDPVPGPDPVRDLFFARYRIASQYVEGSVIDAACGHGVGTFVLHSQPKVTDAVGLDINAAAVSMARQHVPNPHVEYRVANLETDELPECDWFVTLETVEHLPDHLGFLQQVKQVAFRGIVLSTPIVPVSHRPGNYHDFTPKEINGWFKDWKKVHDSRLKEVYRGKYQDAYMIGAWTR